MTPTATPLTGEQRSALASSTDPKELVNAAVAGVRSPAPGDHQTLLDLLITDEFLGRLDSESDYREASRFRLRVARVVDVLAKNPAPSARAAFHGLIKDEGFVAQPDRADALLEASVHVRPPSADLVTFWENHFVADDEFTSTTERVLIENGSRPAIDLLEKKMVDPTHEDDEKVAWMRTDILSHRNDVLLLEMCERLLAGPLPEALCPALVEAIFDYRPGDWYMPAKSYSAPLLESASREALEVLLRLAIFALTQIRLTDEQRSAVKSRMELAEQLRARWPA